MSQAKTEQIIQALRDKNHKDGALALPKAGLVSTHLAELSKLLSDNPNVTALDLSDNGLSDIAAVTYEHVIAQPQIRQVNLSSNKIGELGSVSISRGMAVNPSLESIDLTQNNIPDSSGVRIVQALGNNTTSAMHTLNLTNNQLGNDTAVALGKLLTPNKRPTWLPNIAPVNFFIKLFGFNDTDIRLKTLRLTSNNIDDKGGVPLVRGLALNGSIEALDLENNNIGKDTFREIIFSMQNNKMPNLRVLNLNAKKTPATGIPANRKLADDDILILAEILTTQSTKLTNLSLSGWEISEKGAIALAKALKNNKTLTGLYINGAIITESVCDSFRVALESNTKLKYLNPTALANDRYISNHLLFNTHLARYEEALTELKTEITRPVVDQAQLDEKFSLYQSAYRNLLIDPDTQARLDCSEKYEKYTRECKQQALILQAEIGRSKIGDQARKQAYIDRINAMINPKKPESEPVEKAKTPPASPISAKKDVGMGEQVATLFQGFVGLFTPTTTPSASPAPSRPSTPPAQPSIAGTTTTPEQRESRRSISAAKESVAPVPVDNKKFAETVSTNIKSFLYGLNKSLQEANAEYAYPANLHRFYTNLLNIYLETDRESSQIGNNQRTILLSKVLRNEELPNDKGLKQQLKQLLPAGTELNSENYKILRSAMINEVKFLNIQLQKMPAPRQLGPAKK